MLAYELMMLVGDCVHDHMPGTRPLSAPESDSAPSRASWRPSSTSTAVVAWRSGVELVAVPVTRTRSSTPSGATSAGAARGGAGTGLLGARTTWSLPTLTGTTLAPERSCERTRPTGASFAARQTGRSTGTISELYDRRIFAMVASRSRASRSDNAAACTDTTRSSGANQRDSAKVGESAADRTHGRACADAVCAPKSATAPLNIERRLRTFTGSPTDGRPAVQIKRCTVSLPLDASADREGNTS